MEVDSAISEDLRKIHSELLDKFHCDCMFPARKLVGVLALDDELSRFLLGLVVIYVRLLEKAVFN